MEHEEDGVFSIYMPTGCGMGELGERWGLKGMKLAREVWRSGEGEDKEEGLGLTKKQTTLHIEKLTFIITIFTFSRINHHALVIFYFL